ncbi:MAG: hypothetical protein H6767_05320 [Candidatus Peribacteria bacterium]|nr:MAG: hypothetical protein H6767_05320 [Candidatus Peribacteria bacterium]
MEEGAYRRAEQFYADYTHAQIVVVQYLIGDPRVAYNGRFDESLYKAVVYYQRQHELVEDGMA